LPTAFSAFFPALLCFLSSWDEGIKKMTMSVLSGDSSFSACFFLCFLALFYSVLCLNSGTKPKLGLVLCFLPLVFVFSPLSLLHFLCYVSVRLVCWACALGSGEIGIP
jgi:hypothetical protein